MKEIGKLGLKNKTAPQNKMKRHCGESVPAIHKFKKKFHHADLSKQNPFPVNKILEADLEKAKFIYTGFFTGMSVEIFDDQMIRKIFDEGCYGKGSISRSAPKLFNNKYTNGENMINQRQYIKRQEWNEKFFNELNVSPEKVIVVPDEVNIERYMNDLKKSEQTQQVDDESLEKLDNPYVIPETLILFLEEAFFLHDTLKCLQIRDTTDAILQTSDILDMFCKINPNFMTNFVAYLYLKKKNWVIKSGMKFGGDYCEYAYFAVSSIDSF
jgi:tRNA splicing endonuclease